jgi:hypothetical protein
LQEKIGDVDGQMPITGPSRILAFESTGKFPRFRASMVSATIDADWLNQHERARVCPGQRPALQYRQCGAPTSNN